jgi:hypothetical protein
VPIIGRTLKECFDKFAKHVRQLCAATLSASHHLVTMRTRADDDTEMKLSFHQGDDPIAVPLKTKAHGRIYFYVGQLLRAEPDGSHYRLETRAYWYRLQTESSLAAHAAIRWEYERELDEGKRHCRHHIQQRAHLNLGTASLDLNKAHVPTGWVTIEEVIRFLLVDLGVKPPCGSTWPDVLEMSERKFYEEFTSKRYTSPKARGRH